LTRRDRFFLRNLPPINPKRGKGGGELLRKIEELPPIPPLLCSGSRFTAWVARGVFVCFFPPNGFFSAAQWVCIATRRLRQNSFLDLKSFCRAKRKHCWDGICPPRALGFFDRLCPQRVGTATRKTALPVRTHARRNQLWPELFPHL